MLEKKNLGLNSEIFFNTLCVCVCVCVLVALICIFDSIHNFVNCFNVHKTMFHYKKTSKIYDKKTSLYIICVIYYNNIGNRSNKLM